MVVIFVDRWFWEIFMVYWKIGEYYVIFLKMMIEGDIMLKECRVWLLSCLIRGRIILDDFFCWFVKKCWKCILIIYCVNLRI